MTQALLHHSSGAWQPPMYSAHIVHFTLLIRFKNHITAERALLSAVHGAQLTAATRTQAPSSVVHSQAANTFNLSKWQSVPSRAATRRCCCRCPPVAQDPPNQHRKTSDCRQKYCTVHSPDEKAGKAQNNAFRIQEIGAFCPPTAAVRRCRHAPGPLPPAPLAASPGP